MKSFLKVTPYRNQKLLDLASKCPECQYCKEPNRGQVVLAHSNHLKDGKGLSVKAHDIPCYVCDLCHSLIDGRIGKHLTTKERDAIRFEATYNSVLWLLREDWLRVK